MKSPGHGFSPYLMLRSRCLKRFSKSKKFLPASMIVIETPGRSSDSFCDSMAALIPAPMMQTSDSCVAMLRQPRRAFHRISQPAAIVALDREPVQIIFPVGRVVEESQQIRRDMPVVGPLRNAIEGRKRRLDRRARHRRAERAQLLGIMRRRTRRSHLRPRVAVA